MRNKDSNKTACGDEDRALLDQFRNTTQERTKQYNDKEESLLGTFIHWISNPDKSKKNNQTKQTVKPEKGKKKLNFLKKGGKDKSNPPTSEELRILNERLSRLESNLLFQNVHLSRPSTPKPIPSTSKPAASVEPKYDKYRVMYLLVRVEEQLEHTRKVVQKMQENGAKRSRVRSVSKVMRQLESQQEQLLRILANDTAILAQFENAGDIDLFFQNIDSICSATQEIVFDADDCDTLYNSDLFLRKDGKVKRKKLDSSSGELKSAFADGASEQEDTSTSESGVRNTKEFLEKYRRRCSKDDVCKNSGNGDKNKLMYKSEAIENWSDTDTDEEMKAVELGESQRYKWPILNTNDEKTLAKEKKLHTLMTEIDDLMQDVGLADKKSKKNGITYEVLMMGSGEMTKKAEKQEATSKKKYKQFDTNPDRFKGAKSKKPTTLREAKAVKKSKSQSDQFVEELDRLLNECDKKK